MTTSTKNLIILILLLQTSVLLAIDTDSARQDTVETALESFSSYRPNYMIWDHQLDTKFYLSNKVLIGKICGKRSSYAFYPYLTMSMKAWFLTGTTKSKSFGEINFNPSAFLRLTRGKTFGNTFWNLVAPVRLDAGIEHESTGDVKLHDAKFDSVYNKEIGAYVEDFGSRGWNRWFMEAKWQSTVYQDTLYVYVRGWLKFGIEDLYMPGAMALLGDLETQIVYDWGDYRISNRIRWSGQYDDALISSQTDVYFRPWRWNFYAFIQHWYGFGEKLREYDRRTHIPFQVGIMLKSQV